MRKFLMSVLIAVLLVMPVAAQDGTIPVTLITNTPVIDEAVIGATIIAPAGEDTALTPDPSPEGEGSNTIKIDPATIGLIALVMGGVLGAAAGAGGSAVVFFRSIDQRTKDDAERLYQALPPALQDKAMGLINLYEARLKDAEAALKFAREITDGQPNTGPISG